MDTFAHLASLPKSLLLNRVLDIVDIHLRDYKSRLGKDVLSPSIA
jgi:hypothetical protein